MTTVLRQSPQTRFTLPDGLGATETPEARGLERDQVRLLVAGRSGIQHARFADLGRFVGPGDLVVVNTSATLPAAVDGIRADGRGVTVHFSTRRDDRTWVVELREPDGSGPQRDGNPGETVRIPAGGEVTLLEPAGEQDPCLATRLWRSQVRVDGTVESYLSTHGRPITYRHLHQAPPLSAYQTVFAREPGSAEMPSAGRPFSARLVADLVSAGVAFAPIVLHAGVSSPEIGEPPQPERFAVSADTARRVNHVRRFGGRVIAVGTTVTRALETVADPDGTVREGAGWTDLVLGPDRPARTVTGLVTGWHEPEASHLLLLEAVAGPGLVQDAYDAALANGYLWHEFGDSALLLP